MKPFDDLSQRGQALRLRQMAIAALEQYPLKIKNVSLLAYNFNCIFRVDTTDRQKYVLRINLPGNRTLNEITAELLWLAALRRDTGLFVPNPLARLDGGFITTVSVPGVPQARHCAVFDWVAGHDLGTQVTAANYEKLGVFTTYLHEHAAGFSLPPELKLHVFDKVLPIHRKHTILDDDFQPDATLTKERLKLFREVNQRVSAVLKRVYAANGKPRILHTDLHQWNMRLYRGQMRALDFDDCALGQPLNDVGITFYYASGHPEYPALREAYQRGYESRLPWPVQQPGDLEAIIAGRSLLLIDVLWHENNPKYEKTLPGFVERSEARLREYLDG